MWLDLLANQSPPDFLHDPFGQFVITTSVAIIVGLGTAAVAIWIFRKQQTHKKLTYEIVSDAPLVSVNKGLENRVTIQLDGKPVPNARLLTIRMLNAGNVAIKRDDYADPIRFAFPDRTIIGSDVIATDPPDLINSIDKTTFVKLGTDTAELEKFLLNPKDAVKFTVFLAGASDQFEVIGRIVDGKIEKDAGSRRSGPLITTFTAVVLLVTVAFIFAGYWFGFSWTGFSNKTLWDWLQLLGVLAIPVVVALGAAWFTRTQQLRNS
jgi:hypothetical protein